MAKGASIFFALFLFFTGCSTRTAVQPSSLPPPIESPYFPDEYFSGISLETILTEEAERAKTEAKKETKEEVIKEETKGEVIEEKEEKERVKDEEETKKVEVSHLALSPLPVEAPKESLSLPDITVSQIFLKQRRKLFATLTNTGTAPFPMENGGLSLSVDGRMEKRYALKSLTEQAALKPQESITLPIPFSLFNKKEVEVRVDSPEDLKELNKENNSLKRVLEGSPIGPDIIIKDFDLTEDLELMILLSNIGEANLRKGVTFRIRIYLNDRKISDFEHFILEEIKAYSKNLYALLPPYRVIIRGISKVRVSVAPKLRSDDIRMENNVLERRFIIFPFQIGGQGKEQFSFYVPSPPPREEEFSDKIKMEVRWEEAIHPLKFSFGGAEGDRAVLDISGTSPVKVEWPIQTGDPQRESHWRVSMTNPFEKRAEGHLIIQHP